MSRFLFLAMILVMMSCSSVQQINNRSLMSEYELKALEPTDFNGVFNNVSRAKENQTYPDTLMNEFDFTGCKKFYSEVDSNLTCSLNFEDNKLIVRLMSGPKVLSSIKFKAKLKDKVLKLETFSRFHVDYGILNTFAQSNTYLMLTNKDELLLYRKAHGSALFVVFPVFSASHYVEACFERAD